MDICVFQSGWHKAKPRDMSKYKSLDVRVPTTPNNVRATFKRLIHKEKPVKTQVLPRTKSFAGKKILIEHALFQAP
jgi:hypothetical protein